MVIIFGTEHASQLAWFYLKKDSPYVPGAFSVHGKYMKEDTFCGLPVIPFEEVQNRYPPDQNQFFAPLYAREMNKFRERIYNEIKAKGYKCITYKSSKATIWSDDIGENTFIGEDSTIQPFTKIGNNVVIWAGNHIGHHSVIKDHVYVCGQCTVSGHCVVEPNCFLGVNCSTRDGITLGQGTLVVMDSSVTADTDPWGVYYGAPAKKSEKKTSLEVKL